MIKLTRNLFCGFKRESLTPPPLNATAHETATYFLDALDNILKRNSKHGLLLPSNTLLADLGAFSQSERSKFSMSMGNDMTEKNRESSESIEPLRIQPIESPLFLHEKITRNVDRSIEAINAYALTLNKTDSTAETNEDASFIEDSPLNVLSANKNKTFAISDGATSSPDARTWANMLVEASTLHESDKDIFPAVIQELRTSWEKTWEKQKQKQISTNAGWWTETALNKPNAATYCSITFTNQKSSNSSEIHWRAIAMGDSCLFQIRNNKLMLSFPLVSENEFTDRPVLVRSKGEIINSDKIMHLNGTAQVNDIFLLATDALAEWIFKYGLHTDKTLSSDFYKKLNSIDFEKFIESERQVDRIKDDDSTIINIGVK